MVGQTLELKFELFPDQHYQCKIKIRHIDNGCMGSEIMEADRDAEKAYLNFVQRHAEDVRNRSEEASKRRTH